MNVFYTRFLSQFSIIHCPADYPYPFVMACIYLLCAHFFRVILILRSNPCQSLTKPSQSYVSVVWWVAWKQSHSEKEKKIQREI